MFPGIVPQHLFETVKIIVSENRHVKSPENVVYLLRNKIKSGYCGKSIASKPGMSKSGKMIGYYKCSNRKTDLNNCPKPIIRKEKPEQLIVDITIITLN